MDNNPKVIFIEDATKIRHSLLSDLLAFLAAGLRHDDTQ